VNTFLPVGSLNSLNAMFPLTSAALALDLYVWNLLSTDTSLASF